MRHFLLLGMTLSSLQASTIILDSGSFNEINENTNGGALGVVDTASFTLTVAQIQDVSFTSNFTTIDAGIRISINGTILFDTGDDVSQYRNPSAFTPTINDPFNQNGNVNGIPRLTVQSNSTGTTFSGSPTLNSTLAVAYTPNNFTVANFTNLLQAGSNTIEIINLNSFQGAGLTGDFEVSIVPEPSTSLLFALGLVAFGTRRRR